MNVKIKKANWTNQKLNIKGNKNKIQKTYIIIKQKNLKYNLYHDYELN